MERSAEPVRTYVPAPEEKARAWIGAVWDWKRVGVVAQSGVVIPSSVSSQALRREVVFQDRSVRLCLGQSLDIVRLILELSEWSYGSGS